MTQGLTPNDTMQVPPEICANDPQSFAAYTLRHRLPHIIQDIIAQNAYSAAIVDQLNTLTQEIETGTFDLSTVSESESLSTSQHLEATIWQTALQTHAGKGWFTAPFFFVEMYFYWRIIKIVQGANASDSKVHDPFLTKKQKGLDDAHPQLLQLAQWLSFIGPNHHPDSDPNNDQDSSPDNQQNPLEQALEQTLEQALWMNLWANRADLSQLSTTFKPESMSLPEAQSGSASASNQPFSRKCLINDTQNAIAYILHRVLHQSTPLGRVDIILDNTGNELIADLAFVDILLTKTLVNQVVLHAKRYPIFVSDATKHDIHFTITSLRESEVATVRQWGDRLQQWIVQGQLSLQDHYFWTLPLYFEDMTPDLLAEMQTSALWICKGDANYRRLVGDRHWDCSTPIESITQYLPAPCLALRVLKCELLVGMDKAQLDRLDLEDNWMINGTHGIIQFVDPHKQG